MPEFLKVGDRSPRVAEVRSTLARLGLLPNWEGSAAEENSPQWSGDDDLFDEDMRNALLAFQQSRGVYATASSATAPCAYCEKLRTLWAPAYCPTIRYHK